MWREEKGRVRRGTGRKEVREERSLARKLPKLQND